jgi:photosystem II biogenesis protein Psp29
VASLALATRCLCQQLELELELRSHTHTPAPSLLRRTVAVQQPLRRVAAVSAPRAARTLAVSAAAGVPTVADTKAKFMSNFTRPLPSLYSTVVLELLVQQHLFRHNASYKYTPIQALGVCSVFDQILQGLPEGEQEAVFSAYIQALDESPEQYRKDAAALAEQAKAAGSLDSLMPASNAMMAGIADAVSSGKFLYTKFFAVGIFRMLELAGLKEPKDLQAVVAALGVPLERVNADLVTYKGILSKLKMAKTIMEEFLAREKKKQAERQAEKAKKAEEVSAA